MNYLEIVKIARAFFKIKIFQLQYVTDCLTERNGKKQGLPIFRM